MHVNVEWLRGSGQTGECLYGQTTLDSRAGPGKLCEELLSLGLAVARNQQFLGLHSNAWRLTSLNTPAQLMLDDTCFFYDKSCTVYSSTELVYSAALRPDKPCCAQL